MTYDLARLARRAGLKTNRTLRPIEITDTLKRSLYAIAVKPVRAWRLEVSERILPAYGRALDTLTRDDESDDMAQAIRIAEAIVAGASVEVTVEVEQWLKEAIRWHEKKWVSAVKAGSGVDVFPFIDNLESLPKVRAFQERIAGLIQSISDTARKDVAETVWRGFVEQTPRRKMGKQIAERLGIQQRRANTIAIDQSQKLNGELTRIRMGEAGLSFYKWRHSGKIRFRPEHKARDGKVFRLGQPAGDQCGYKPFCGCVEMPIIDVEEKYAA